MKIPLNVETLAFAVVRGEDPDRSELMLIETSQLDADLLAMRLTQQTNNPAHAVPVLITVRRAPE